MGDVRFRRALERIRAAADQKEALQQASTDELIMALAASSPDHDALLANVLASELQNRARRSMAVGESITEGVILLDERGRVTYVNPFGERLLGRAARDLLGTHVSRAVRLVDPRGTALDAERLDHRPLTLHARDGRRVPVDALAAPIRAQEEVLGTVLALRDVTYQRAIEDDLRLHKRLLDAVGEAVIATRPEGTVFYWNQGAERLYGWRAEEALGREVGDLTLPETAREQGESIMASLQKGEPWSGVFPVRRRDGAPFLARVTDTPVLDEAGNLVAIIGISHPHRG